MNIENMEKLLERLKSERNPVAFNMRHWFRHGLEALWDRDEIIEVIETHACDTAACLAGQAAVLAFEEGFVEYETVEDTATAWLGLGLREAHDLFLGWWEGWYDLEGQVDEVDGAPALPLLTLDMAITEVTRLITEARAA